MNEGSYYLDRHLTLAESTHRFSDGGREIPEEGHYVVAIRRRSHLGWVFRFSRHFQDLELMITTLNRPRSPALTMERPSPDAGGTAESGLTSQRPLQKTA